MSSLRPSAAPAATVTSKLAGHFCSYSSPRSPKPNAFCSKGKRPALRTATANMSRRLLASKCLSAASQGMVASLSQFQQSTNRNLPLRNRLLLDGHAAPKVRDAAASINPRCALHKPSHFQRNPTVATKVVHAPQSFPSSPPFGASARGLDSSFAASSAISAQSVGPAVCMAYGGHDYSTQTAVDDFEPEVIQWERGLVNQVHLIGHLGRDVSLSFTRSQARVGGTTLAVKRAGANEGDEKPTDWFTLEFWGDLAEHAEGVLRKGTEVYVTGTVHVDEWIGSAGDKRITVKVRVRDFKLVARGEPNRRQPVTNGNGQSEFGAAREEDQYGAAPRQFQDGSPRQFSGRISAERQETLWNMFFENPDLFYDNRKNKRNPRGPDLKHKETQEALWVDGYSTPKWVVDALAVYDERREEIEGNFQ